MKSLQYSNNASESQKALKQPKVVISIKKKSSEVANKNKVLIHHVLPKLKDFDVTVMSNDFEQLEELRKTYPIKTFELHHDELYLQRDLREWRDHFNFQDEVVVLVQVTSPNLKPEWITACANQITYKNCFSATCVKCDFKISTCYVQKTNKAWMQAAPNFGSPILDRQNLPTIIRLSGAVFAFHSSALDYETFYDVGNLYPVIIDEEDALDIDTQKQFDKFIEQKQKL